MNHTPFVPQGVPPVRETNKLVAYGIAVEARTETLDDLVGHVASLQISARKSHPADATYFACRLAAANSNS